MGAWFSRVGSDRFYGGYEKSLNVIRDDIERLEARRRRREALFALVRRRGLGGFLAIYAAVLAQAAYVLRAPPGTYSIGQHARRVSPALYVPAVAAILARLLAWLRAALARRDERRASSLSTRRKQLIADLKDSSRFDRMVTILKEHDPEWKAAQLAAAAAAAAAAARPGPGRPGVATPGSVSGAPRAAASAAKAAGSRVAPLLADFWARAADTLIADDPAALELLRAAQTDAAQLRVLLARREADLSRVRAENALYRDRLGLPPAEQGEEGEEDEGGEEGGEGEGLGPQAREAGAPPPRAPSPAAVSAAPEEGGSAKGVADLVAAGPASPRDAGPYDTPASRALYADSRATAEGEPDARANGGVA